jgi:hypothetical protein
MFESKKDNQKSARASVLCVHHVMIKGDKSGARHFNPVYNCAEVEAPSLGARCDNEHLNR